MVKHLLSSNSGCRLRSSAYLRSSNPRNLPLIMPASTGTKLIVLNRFRLLHQLQT